MSKRQKVKSILLGMLTMVCVICMVTFPQEGYHAMIIIVSMSLLYYAIKKFLYYFTMTRWMIGGSMILCKGIIGLDLAWFMFTLRSVPKFYVTMYLVIGLLFSAVIGILKSLESKRLKDPSWKYKFMNSIFSIALSILCFVFIPSIHVAVYVFCLGFVQSALTRIRKAWQKNEIIYIA